MLYSSITYYPNGSVTIDDFLRQMGDMTVIHDISRNFYTTQNGTDRIAQEPTYQQMQSKNPIPNHDVAADLFINKTSSSH